MRLITRNTQLCISASSNPGVLGSALHNWAYDELGLDFLYKPYCVEDITQIISAVRIMGIRGCSVSMPFKHAVIPSLDSLDESAKNVGAVNSIVNTEGHLRGFNTDIVGALKALQFLQVTKNDTILMYGAGGAARAILLSLSHIGVKKVFIMNRTPGKVENLKGIHPCNLIGGSEINSIRADYLINATSIGMNQLDNEIPFCRKLIKQSKGVMEVVVSPYETKLVSMARSLNKPVAPGYLMSFEQFRAQFLLYTGVEIPREVAMKKLLGLIRCGGA
jgi:shikimate dehydrogenase